MIDIHTHLHFKDYDADRDEVIARARAAGVETMILVGTDLESSRAAIELAEQYDFLYASVGIHPHEFNQSTVNNQQRTVSFRTSPRAEESTGNKTGSSTALGMTGEEAFEQEGWTKEFRELARHPKVVAVGECGLDYFARDPEQLINDEQKARQKEGFLAQIGIAKEFSLPMIIHTRPSAGTMDAYEDVFKIIVGHSKRSEESRGRKGGAENGISRQTRNDMRFVLHCYQGDTEITKKFIPLPSVFFSFAGSITYPVKKLLEGTKNDPREVLKLVPTERLFVETDCPYLAPQPVRGTRNEPMYVTMTAKRIAEIKGVGMDELESGMGARFSKVFRWSKMDR